MATIEREHSHPVGNRKRIPTSGDRR
ncbi:hypothetical protein Gorai_020830 [Gossypium raimondii]|uniref:Uncharacterized protein n=1 Tax=Gossypium raimondii TaxID=29730 RepID=A0A7J8NNI3_GOSRA|nr:hypothetical protein [Gossypium raimondii]